MNAKEVYFSNDHTKVQGWVMPGALSALLRFDEMQAEFGIGGSLAEIGVHHGKYLIALAHLLRAGESLVGFDVFDEQEKNVDKSGLGNREITERNIATHFGATGRTKLVKADSLTLTPQQVLGTVASRIRLFSVDGGHTEFHTVNDLMVAQDCLTHGGVIVLDDFWNADWPGVAEGAHRFFLTSCLRKIAPVAYGDNKLYLATRSHRDDYFRKVSEWSDAVNHRKLVSLWGHDVWHLRMAAPYQAGSQ